MPKGFGYGPETNKQERKNLMQDMPVVKDATGGRSWMSKHSKSAFQMGHSPAEMTSDDEKKSKFRKDIDEKRDLVDNPFYGDNTYQGFTLDKSARESRQIPRSVVENIYKRVHERDKKNPVQMGHSPLEKKVKVNYKGKELTLDDRSQEYKYIMKHKENKQVKTEAVIDRLGTNYTGLKKS